MAGEWPATTLGEVTEFLSGGTPSKDRAAYWGGSIPWVSAKDMKRFRIDDTEDHLSEDGVANGTRLVPAGSVLMLARGMTLLNDVPICLTGRPMTFNQDVKALRARSHVRSEFLPYLLLGNKDRLLSLVDLAGHGTGRLNSDELKALDVVLPPEPEQRAIAHILGTLDDKIELNRRMNETLEAMARALFKSWFVDFDPVRAKAQGCDPGLPQPIADLFPDSFDDSQRGEIPRGWLLRRIDELSEQVAMGPFGSSIKVETFTGDGIPVISGQHLRGTLLDDSEYNFISEEHADKLKRANVRRGDIVFTHAGIIGQVAYVPDSSRYERYVISQRQFYVRCDPQKMSPLFIASYFKTPEGQHRLLANTSSTGVPSISQPVSYLRQLQIVVPAESLLQAFDSIARTVFGRVAANRTETASLGALRNSLLPKLISGELRVKDPTAFRGGPA